ncbi:MAG: hypothetical protein R2860_04570 [Desulfobacterales bacterium]
MGIYAGTGSYERSFKDTYQLKGSEIYLASSVLFPSVPPPLAWERHVIPLWVCCSKLTMGCLHIDMFSDVDNSRSDSGVGYGPVQERRRRKCF